MLEDTKKRADMELKERAADRQTERNSSAGIPATV